MKIRSILASGALALAVVGGSVAGAGAASAQYTPVPTATGSVALAQPIQYASFFVFGGYGQYHGWINYTNFTYPAAHTNVWNIGGTHALVFTVGSSQYTHTMNVTTVTPTSTHSTTFSGTGSYTTDPSYTWTVTGTVNWNKVSFSIVYTGTNAGYKVSGLGWIKPDGSVYGTATDSNNATLQFTMPAGSALQVLSYTAPVRSASIWDHTATFRFTIPKGTPLAGVRVVVKVHQGSHGYQSDTWAHGVAGYPLTQYPITSGYIFVRH